MTRRERGRGACLAALLAAALAALASSHAGWAAWALLALPVLSLLVELPVLPPSLVSTLKWAARGLVLLCTLVATGLWTPYPIGLALGVLAGVFLLAPRSFSTGGAFLPATLAVFLMAAATPHAPYLSVAVWTGTAALASWLLTSSVVFAHPRRLLATALFLVPAAAVGASILRFLPWAQPHVETVAFRYMAPDTAEAGLGLGAGLGSIEQLALSPRVVLRLWSDRPLALRASVFTSFNGRFWQASRNAPLPRALPPGPVSGRLVRVVIESPLRGVLPAPSSVRAVRSAEPDIRIDSFGIVQAPPRSPDVYEVVHGGAPEPAIESDPLAAEYLETPADLDPRVRALAHGLGPRDAPVPARIERTVSHLRSHYRYALKVGKWRTADPLAEFLFDKKQGYCEYFATAAVVLLRLQGVPARYVNGLSVRDENRMGDHYLVRAGDAHAWAEALVPGAGWAEVDATPSGAYRELHEALAPSPLERWLESAKGRWADLYSRLREHRWSVGGLDGAVAAVALVLVGLGAVGVRAWRRRRLSPARAVAAHGTTAIDPGVHACLVQVERLWEAAGHPRPAHRAPLEHARTLPGTHEDLRLLSIEVVDCVYRHVYAGHAITPEEAKRLSQALSGFVTRG